MVYQVIIPRKVQKELEKTDKKCRLKIIVALGSLEKDPFRGKKLEGAYKDLWSFRVWPYRIIYKIEKKKLIVILVKVGHRQGVY